MSYSYCHGVTKLYCLQLLFKNIIHLVATFIFLFLPQTFCYPCSLPYLIKDNVSADGCCIVWTDERHSLITLDSCMTSPFIMEIQRKRIFFLTHCELQACCACHHLEALCDGGGGLERKSERQETEN